MSGRVLRGGEALTLQGTPLSKWERRKLRRAVKRWARGGQARPSAPDNRGGRLIPLGYGQHARLPIGPTGHGPLRVGDRIRLLHPDDLLPVIDGKILLIHPDGADVWDNALLTIVMDDNSEIMAAPDEVQLIIRVSERSDRHGR